jgi:putative N6-adenine-specific DNA methylase
MRDADDLYRRALRFDWSDIIRPNQTFAIEPNVHSRFFRHPHFASLRLKDAIADQFRQRTGGRPDVQPENPDVLLHLHIDEHQVTISLDSSGDSLNRRGYRGSGALAPLNEVLAAAVVAHSGWIGQSALVEPMCGSGTLAIEAYLKATNTPSQRLWSSFGFMRWEGFSDELWQFVKDQADARTLPLAASIIALDAAPQAVRIATANAKYAGIPPEAISFRVADFFDFEKPGDSGMLLFNPPYGERIDPEQLELFYRKIGDTFKHNWSGWEAWVLSGNMEALKRLGLRPNRRIPLMNSTIECRLAHFNLYEGKKHTPLRE